MTDCPRIGKLFGGCKFSPRYDVGAPTLGTGELGGSALGIVALVEASKPKTYIGDVCERCGKVIRKSSGSPPIGASERQRAATDAPRDEPLTP